MRGNFEGFSQEKHRGWVPFASSNAVRTPAYGPRVARKRPNESCQAEHFPEGARDSPYNDGNVFALMFHRRGG